MFRSISLVSPARALACLTLAAAMTAVSHAQPILVEGSTTLTTIDPDALGLNGATLTFSFLVPTTSNYNADSFSPFIGGESVLVSSVQATLSGTVGGTNDGPIAGINTQYAVPEFGQLNDNSPAPFNFANIGATSISLDIGWVPTFAGMAVTPVEVPEVADFGFTTTNVSITDLTNFTSYSGSGGPVTATVIPEPATLALLGLGGVALLRRRRR